MSLLQRVGELIDRRKAVRLQGTGEPDGSPTASDPGPPEPRAPAPAALPAPDLPELEAQARYHRDRLALYRARALSAKPVSQERLRDLQRASEAADARLRHARRPDQATSRDR